MNPTLRNYILRNIGPSALRLELVNRLENLCTLTGTPMSPELHRWVEDTFGLDMVRILEGYSSLTAPVISPQLQERINRIVPNNYQGENVNLMFKQQFDVSCAPPSTNCLYYLVINSQDLGAGNWIGWSIDGVNIYSSGYTWYPNNFGYQSLVISYIGTQPTIVTLDDGFGNLFPFTVEKVTNFGGSCQNVCYQAEFDNGYNLIFIDYFQLGGATPAQYAPININDEVVLESYINTLLGTTNADVSSVWNGFKYVVTINNAYNLGGLIFNIGLPDETTFSILPC